MQCKKCNQALNASGVCDHCLQNNKKNTIMLFSLVFFVLFVFAGSIVFFSLRKSKSSIVFNRVIDTAASLFNVALFNLNDDVTYTYNVSSVYTNYNEDNEFLLSELLNKLNFVTSIEFNFNKKLMNIEFESLYNVDSIIKTNINFNNYLTYLKLDGLDEAIVLPVNNNLYDNIFSQTDSNALINEFFEQIKNSLTDDYYSTNNSDYLVDENPISINEYILDLKGENLRKFSIALLSKLKKSDNFIDLITKNFYVSENDINDYIEIYIDEMQNTLIPDEYGVIFNIYTKSGTEEFFGFSIEYQTGGIARMLKVTTSSENTFDYSFDLVEDGNFTISTGKIIFENKSDIHKYDIDITSDDFLFELNVSRKSVITVVNGKNYDNVIDFDLFKEEKLTDFIDDFLNRKGTINLIEDIKSY